MTDKTKELLIIAAFALKNIDESEFDSLMLDWFLTGRASIEGLLNIAQRKLNE